MPNDARLGLVVGVTLVILVAVLFARKDDTPGKVNNLAQSPVPTSTKVLAAPVPGVPGVPPKTTPLGMLPRSHTMEEGETLMSVAVRYYGDAGQVSHLFRANQDRILAPDRIPLGTILRIPELPKDSNRPVSR